MHVPTGGHTGSMPEEEAMLQRLATLCGAVGLVMTAACAQTDPAITTAVKTKLLADGKTPGLQINVETNDGVVTLKGTVPTKAAEDKAVADARATKGVKRVVNNLKVSS